MAPHHGSKNGGKRSDDRQRQEGSSESVQGLLASGPMIMNAGKFLLMLVILPPMMNYGGLNNEKEFFMKESVRYDIGFGQKLYMSCVGSGVPTVILDAPTGTSSDIWIKLQSKLGSVSRICIYDRAGLGLSDASPNFNMSDPGEGAVARTLGPPSTVIRMVSDLHRLVTFTNPLERPLLLVGSELGALVARAYAHLHPQDVHGLVLIDPLSETLFQELSVGESETGWSSYWYGHLIPSLRMLQVASFSGLSRIGLLTGYLSIPAFSDDDLVKGKLKHQLCNPFHIQAAIDEYSHANVSLGQVDEVRSAWEMPANISTTVITGTFYDDQLAPNLNRLWSRSVQNVINRLPGSKHVVLTGADRNSIYKQPDEFVPTITRVIKRWRSSQK